MYLKQGRFRSVSKKPVRMHYGRINPIKLKVRCRTTVLYLHKKLKLNFLDIISVYIVLAQY